MIGGRGVILVTADSVVPAGCIKYDFVGVYDNVETDMKNFFQELQVHLGVNGRIPPRLAYKFEYRTRALARASQ